MKRECGREMCDSRRSMACTMSRSNALNSAVRFSIALRFSFFGFCFMPTPIRK